MNIKIWKTELLETPLFYSDGAAMCPVCGVISNVYPCYGEGQGTAVPHRLTYCNHPLESEVHILVDGETKELV